MVFFYCIYHNMDTTFLSSNTIFLLLVSFTVDMLIYLNISGVVSYVIQS